MMKPTPKPSLLMLWVARFYAFFALGFSMFHFISISLEPDTVVIYQAPAVLTAPTTPGTTGTTTVTGRTHHETAVPFVGTLLLACLFFGLVTLNRKSGQRFVLAAAFGSMGLIFYGLAHLLVLILLSNAPADALLHHSFFWQFLGGSACGCVIQLGNIWLALRPPLYDGHDDGHLPPLSALKPI